MKQALLSHCNFFRNAMSEVNVVELAFWGHFPLAGMQVDNQSNRSGESINKVGLHYAPSPLPLHPSVGLFCSLQSVVHRSHGIDRQRQCESLVSVGRGGTCVHMTTFYCGLKLMLTSIADIVEGVVCDPWHSGVCTPRICWLNCLSRHMSALIGLPFHFLNAYWTFTIHKFFNLIYNNVEYYL